MPDPADALAPSGDDVGHVLGVSDESLVLPGGLDGESTFDVLLNDQHVWSLQPGRDARRADTGYEADWPKALHRFLRGHAEVAVREHVGGSVVGRARHCFGGETDRHVSVRDDQDRELVLDKWGRLTRPLAAEDADLVDELMSQVLQLLTDMTDACGVPAYVAYGTLLGAVRSGRLIAYDNDIDLAYVSGAEQPVDVIREGFRIERVLADRGWDVRRGSAARLNVRLRLSDGSMRFVDVFTSHWLEGTFFVANDIAAPLRRDQVLPLGEVELMGRAVPAPADPPAMLAAAYGEGWQVPDPSFKYETPVWLSRRISGWYGGLSSQRKRWDTFNATAPKRLGWRPTPFARWVAREFPSERPLLEVGSGSGRDALWWAGRGRRVLGIDYGAGAVHRSGRRARRRGLRAEFEALNLYDTRAVLSLGARLARDEEPHDVYARFILHALADPGRDNFWRLASMTLRRGGHLFVEFRTLRDQREHHTFGPHFRRFLDPDEVAAEARAAGGRVVHQEQGRGLSPLRDEDPYLCRMVVEWPGGTE